MAVTPDGHGRCISRLTAITEIANFGAAGLCRRFHGQGEATLEELAHSRFFGVDDKPSGNGTVCAGGFSSGSNSILRTSLPACLIIADRQVLLERWLELTQTHLPALALQHGWPVRLDHCFMRVCLDASLGARWDSVVRRPAIRTLSTPQLACAVAQAEAIVADPALLPSLNRASLRMRHKG